MYRDKVAGELFVARLRAYATELARNPDAPNPAVVETAAVYMKWAADALEKSE